MADEAILTQLLQQRHDYNKKTVLIMAKKCKNDAHIELLLQQTQCDEQVIIELIKKPHLNQQHLLHILAHTLSEDTIKLISEHPAAGPQAIHEILKHSALSSTLLIHLLQSHEFEPEQLALILDNPTAISSAVLTTLLHQSTLNESLVLTILHHPKTDETTINQLIKHRLFNASIATQIIALASTKRTPLNTLALELFDQLTPNPNPSWEQCFDQLIRIIEKNDFITVVQQKRDQVTAHYGLKIMRQWGESIMDVLPINQMIQTANEQELDSLSRIKRTYGLDDFNQLVLKVEQQEQIDTLLARQEMTSTMGDILLKKSRYSGKMGLWSWPNEAQIRYILNNTTEYHSFSLALRHANLSAAAREQWLEQLIFKQKTDKHGLSTKNPQQKLFTVLNDLKVKACTHALKALTNSTYEAAAKSAFELYQSLHKKTLHYVNNPTKYQTFKIECEQDIQNARGILETHRGYKQILLDIVNALFVVVGWLKNGNWRLFKANTDSMNVVEEIRKRIEEPVFHA